MWRFKNRSVGGRPGFVRMTEEFPNCHVLYCVSGSDNAKQPCVYSRTGVGFDEIHKNAWIHSVFVPPTENICVSADALKSYVKLLDDIPDGYEEGDWETNMELLIAERDEAFRVLALRSTQAVATVRRRKSSTRDKCFPEKKSVDVPHRTAPPTVEDAEAATSCLPSAESDLKKAKRAETNK